MSNVKNKNEEQIVVPAGYMMNAKGDLVRKSNIKDIDLERDAVVKRLWRDAERVGREVHKLRCDALHSISALIQRSAKEYDVQLGGKKGNLTITSYDGQYKIMRTISDTIAFTEQLEVARALVHSCLKEFAKGSRKEMRALVDSAFELDNKGNVSVSRVLGLRRVKIEHPQWKKAMDIIADATVIQTSREYIRFYRRKDNGEYEQVPMNLSGA